MKNKQFQGSKKKARKLAYLERHKKKQKAGMDWKRLNEAWAEGGIEAAAKVLGVRLK
jgi:hypothetical protein